MRHVGLLLAAAALVACSSDPDSGSGNNNTNTDGGTSVVSYADISGVVQFHPQELAWRTAVGGDMANPPSLAGAKLNVEDAIKAQGGGDPLMTVDVTVASDGKTGTFEAKHVYVKGSTLALVASVAVPAPANPDDDYVLFSGYGIGKPPYKETMSDLPIYVVSKGFMEHVATVVGRELSVMLDEGIVIGGASNKSHTAGVAGAKLVRLYGTGATARIEDVVDENLFYFNDDLSAATNTERVTSASGFWVRLNAGSASTYTMVETTATKYQEPGKKEFEEHLNGSRAGTALSVFFEEVGSE